MRTAGSSSAVPLERLAEALAAVQRRCPELAVLAVPWMHLKHPLQPVQEALLRGEPAPAGALGFVRRGVEGVCYAGYCWMRLLWLHLWTRKELAALARRPFDLIAKTWVPGARGASREGDFYFGTLQQRLARRGIRMLFVCGNGYGGAWTPFAKACASGPAPRVFELCLVPPAAPWRMLALQWRASLRLRRLAARAEDPLVQRVSVLASRDCLVPETARAGLYYWVGRAAVRTWRPRALLSVYEAHGWEQALRWGAKTAEPSCRVVGHQHVPLFPEAKSLTSPPRIGLPVHPDVILCLGGIPLERLRAGHEPYGTRLVRFGSFWHRGAGVTQPAAPSRRTVLVVPEGRPAEVEALFRFACACAQRAPAYTFILRCHPAFPMTRALRRVLAGLPQRPNVVRSSIEAIEDDFARSSVVLYRGSSAVLYAILHGLLPIHVPMPGGSEQDPLDGLPAWHARCGTPEELAEALARHERVPADERDAAWRQAAQYVQDYTGPVTDGGLEALMEAADLRAPARLPAMEATYA